MSTLNLCLGLGNLLCGLIFAGLAIPMLQGKVPRNQVYGVRLKQALESDENWDRSNRAGGRYMLYWAAVIFLLGLLCFIVPPLQGFWIWFFGLAPALILIGCWQTHRFVQRL